MKRATKTTQLFMRRTYQIYRSMVKRAAESGGAVDFTLSDFRASAEQCFGFNAACCYCGKDMTVKTFSLDHKVPISRGGTFAMANTLLICTSCNKSKGNFTDAEYRVLLKKLDEAERDTRNFEMSAKVLTALRISASFRFGADRRARKS